MPTSLTNHTAICADDPPWSPDEAQVAAAAFLARYSGRTLEAYRHDLRYYFQWATEQHLAVLLGLNGLRVSETCATNIENLAFERDHRRGPRAHRCLQGRSTDKDPERVGSREVFAKVDPATPLVVIQKTMVEPVAGFSRTNTSSS